MKPTIKTLSILAIGLGSLAAGCTDYVQPDRPSPEAKVYRGSVLEYLADVHDDGVKFDSLLYIIDNIPGLRDKIQNAEGEFTLFVPTDESVRNAIESLNLHRKSTDIEGKIYLKDILIEPFNIEDTTIVTVLEEEHVSFSYRHFDYRAKLDSLVSKYFIEGNLTSDVVISEGGRLRVNSILNGSEMMVEAGRHDASGNVGTGLKHLNLIEANNSNQISNWTYSEAAQSDIKANNGTIHVISNNHQFGFNHFIEKFITRGTEKGVCTRL